MDVELQHRLLAALVRCLRPLSKLLLGAGISYAQFDELAKKAFVEAALADAPSSGPGMTTSRVAVRTGLSRKQVARLRTMLGQETISTNTFRVGRPARALQLWHSSAEFQDEHGAPLDLKFDGEEPNFTTLVKRVGGDVPPGAVRAELLAAGGIAEIPNGRLRVKKRFFVPSAFDEDLVVGFAFVVAPMLETLGHNLENPSDAYIQRVAYSDHLPESVLKPFRAMSHGQAEQLMQDVDKWLAEREETAGLAKEGERRVGLGVFYFESQQADTQ